MKYFYTIWKEQLFVTVINITSSFKMSKNVKVVQKYCKVCHDAGKTEAEYRSHFTRESPDPKAKVTCPTLLAQECRYCSKNGHTVKYCPTLKDNEKKRKQDEAKARRIEASQNVAEKSKGKLINQNVFMCLDSDSEEEEEVVTNPVEDFPALIIPVSRNQSVSSNYAAALAKPAAPKQKQEVMTEPIAKLSEAPAVKAPEVVKTVAPWASSAPVAYKSWAAFDSDSDEEEEEEEDEGNDAW